MYLFETPLQYRVVVGVKSCRRNSPSRMKHQMPAYHTTSMNMKFSTNLLLTDVQKGPGVAVSAHRNHLPMQRSTRCGFGSGSTEAHPCGALVHVTESEFTAFGKVTYYFRDGSCQGISDLFDVSG
jgi:hypothetical protein